MYQKRFTKIFGLMIMCFFVGTAGFLFSQESKDQLDSTLEAQVRDYVRAGRRCIVKQRPGDLFRVDAPLKSAGDCTMSRTSIKNEYWPSATYTIPVVFHIIHKSNGTGNIPDARVNAQVKVLNDDYKAAQKGFNTKIQFKLAGITRTANDGWHNDQDEVGFKRALGWDQKKYMNVYVTSSGGYLGYAYLPQENSGDVYDGVVVLYNSVGGRNNGYAPYDQGRTLVHEVGHYLGLLHTFDGGGCFEGYTSGDLIGDTHSENAEHYDCQQTSSCGTPDDIHNYMNYTEDTCMSEFTPDQANRMVCSLVNYRSQLYQNTAPPPPPSPVASVKVTSPNGGESWNVGSSHTVRWTSTGTVGNVRIQYSVNNGSSWSNIASSTANDGQHSWTVPDRASTQCRVRVREASDGNPTDTSNAKFSIVKSTSPPPPPGGSPVIALNRSSLNFSAADNGRTTGSQQLWLNNSGNGTLNWRVSVNRGWLTCTPNSGTDSGVLTVFVNPSGMWPGDYSGTITISDPNASNSSKTVTVNLKVIDFWEDRKPFGAFGTPTDGSVARSSIPVTGWALDDVEVKTVKIYRRVGNGSKFVGDAVFVEGARPDVEVQYADYPRNHMAGWGYMLLTNFLPDGTHVISAVAIDSSGNRTNLGSRTIYVDNAGAVKPFGAIDSPAQGGSASGRNYRNQGWVLATSSYKIPVSGSTIDVYIDGKYIGHPKYNIYRPDIANAFPGYANSNGALAFLDFDSTKYTNGIHSIQWVAKDNAGNKDGIGSRYFTIRNSSSRQSAAGIKSKARLIPDRIPVAAVDRSKPIEVKKGYDSKIEPRSIYPDAAGNVTVKMRESERIEVRLPGSYIGYSKVGSEMMGLPVGSTFDPVRGIFYWFAGPGFLGRYDLVFIARDESGKVSKINVTVEIAPR
ncbi:MAG: hypothetical protein GY940_25945 [bacterium]|nr:hypothetical protein [bacterium]